MMPISKDTETKDIGWVDSSTEIKPLFSEESGAFPVVERPKTPVELQQENTRLKSEAQLSSEQRSEQKKEMESLVARNAHLSEQNQELVARVEALEAKLNEVKDRTATMIRRIPQRLALMRDRSMEAVVHCTVELAEHLSSEISKQDAAGLRSRLTKALGELEQGDEATLTLSEEDYAWVRCNLEYSKEGLKVLSASSLHAGEFTIETDSAFLDGRVLERVEDYRLSLSEFFEDEEENVAA